MRNPNTSSPSCSPQPPSFSWNPNSKKNLRFEYHYEFLPAGVFTRFIVRTHGSLMEEEMEGRIKKICWKEGAFLQHENAQARVLVIPRLKNVQIQIIGENGAERREFLAILRKEFKEIHDTIRKIQVTERIPCNCTAGCEYRFDYAFLLKARKKGKTEVICNITAEDVKINALLEGIEGSLSKGPVFLLATPEKMPPSLDVYFLPCLAKAPAPG